MSPLEIIFAVAVLAAFNIYMMPWWIAVRRRNPNALAIFVLNLFLGWSFIGWIIALVWAVTKSSAQISDEYTPRKVTTRPAPQDAQGQLARRVASAGRGTQPRHFEDLM